MEARQPVFRLGRTARRDRFQWSEIDRFVLARRIAPRPGTQPVAGDGDDVARQVAQVAVPPGQLSAGPGPARGTAARMATASSQPAPRSSASAAASAASSYSRPTQSADCASIMSGAAGVGAAHLQEALEPHVGEHGGHVVGEVAHGGVVAGQVVQRGRP